MNGLTYDMVRVDWRKAMPFLKPIINGYRSHWNKVYIGITSAPEFRWNQHRVLGWPKEMVVIYEALTPMIAGELEQDLIDYARRCNFREDIQNIGPGGEGIENGSGHHYLYLLIGDRK
ncbi:hypothetical protein [Archangium violaceum]|uniref:GIY-YIG domain-containing protein n=1 Tax=Archangium violaceum Cb vi76 TaxID=1406225 RepID=A0A084SQS1_9BACT|nr:hypothetical protein [Archangium violaceum]KFA90806.1 hypothetical protein Q664_26190 [Archangium violaceum Cb vi76]